MVRSGSLLYRAEPGAVSVFRVRPGDWGKRVASFEPFDFAFRRIDQGTGLSSFSFRYSPISLNWWLAFGSGAYAPNEASIRADLSAIRHLILYIRSVANCVRALFGTAPSTHRFHLETKPGNGPEAFDSPQCLKSRPLVVSPHMQLNSSQAKTRLDLPHSDSQRSILRKAKTLLGRRNFFLQPFQIPAGNSSPPRFLPQPS